MLPLLVRGLIMYLVVTVGVRFMGKRQIGELQPTELVITILLSDIASQPLVNGETPILQSILLLIFLISLELLSSVIAIKSRAFRLLVQGHSVMIINKGKVDQRRLKELRYSVDDVIEAMRLKDCFDISQIDYAYVETNGELSIKQIDEQKKQQDPLPCLVISDGTIIEKEFGVCNLDEKKLVDILHKKGLRQNDIFLMTYAEDGTMNIIVKKEN